MRKHPLPPPKLSDHIRLYLSGIASLVAFGAFILLAACAACDNSAAGCPPFPIPNPYVR